MYFFKSPQRKRVCRLLNEDFTYLLTYLLMFDRKLSLEREKLSA
jgi:hypothetical protein